VKVIHQIFHARDTFGKINDSLFVVLFHTRQTKSDWLLVKSREAKIAHLLVESFDNIVDCFTKNRRKTNTHSSLLSSMSVSSMIPSNRSKKKATNVCERIFMVTSVSGPTMEATKFVR